MTKTWRNTHRQKPQDRPNFKKTYKCLKKGAIKKPKMAMDEATGNQNGYGAPQVCSHDASGMKRYSEISELGVLA